MYIIIYVYVYVHLSICLFCNPSLVHLLAMAPENLRKPLVRKWLSTMGLQDWHAKVRQAALEALSEANSREPCRALQHLSQGQDVL